MNRHLRNPYWAIIILPLAAFLLLIAISVDPDWISIPTRIMVFGVLAFIAIRYVGRAPILAWNADFSAPARNIVGWGMSISAMMMQQVYGTLYLAYDRPLWLSSQYYSPAFSILMLVGLGLVFSSVPRFWPFGPGGAAGLGSAASFIIGVLSTMALFGLQHLPYLWKTLTAVFIGMTRAF
jgi:hypothetical protein